MARHPRRNLTAHALAWRPVIEQPALLRNVLVAAALPARDRAVAPFDRGSHHAAALSWADGDAAWANADGGVIAPTIPIVAVVAVPPDLNVDALGHLEVLGLRRSSGWGSRQHHCDCRQNESDLHHRASSLGYDTGSPSLPGLGAPRGRPRSFLRFLTGAPLAERTWNKPSPFPLKLQFRMWNLQETNLRE